MIGSFGKVYKAWDTQNNIYVALKVRGRTDQLPMIYIALDFFILFFVIHAPVPARVLSLLFLGFYGAGVDGGGGVVVVVVVVVLLVVLVSYGLTPNIEHAG